MPRLFHKSSNLSSGKYVHRYIVIMIWHFILPLSLYRVESDKLASICLSQIYLCICSIYANMKLFFFDRGRNFNAERNLIIVFPSKFSVSGHYSSTETLKDPASITFLCHKDLMIKGFGKSVCELANISILILESYTSSQLVLAPKKSSISLALDVIII